MTPDPWDAMEAAAALDGYRYAYVSDDPTAANRTVRTVKVGPGILHGVLSSSSLGALGLHVFDGLVSPPAAAFGDLNATGNLMFDELSMLVGWSGPLHVRFTNGLTVAMDTSVTNDHNFCVIFV